MKKYLHLFFCIAISLVLLSGCLNHQDSGEGPENTAAETGFRQGAEATAWEVTKHGKVNNFDGITMKVKEGSVTPRGLRVIFDNKSGSQCTYGEYFYLEKKTTENWYQIPVVIDGNYGFDDIGYPLAPGDNSQLAVDWEWLYGSLDPGDYRIVKDILDFRGTADYDKYYLAAEFTIR